MRIRGRGRAGFKWVWTADERAMVARAYGASPGRCDVRLKELAATLGCSVPTVCREARRLGFVQYGRGPTPAQREAASLLARTRPLNPEFTTRGYVPTVETRAKMQAAARRNVLLGRHPGQRARSQRTRAKISASATRRLRQGGDLAGYSRARGGRRPDLDNRYFRSAWEANYARILTALASRRAIRGWEYECRTFWFKRIKRGTRSYTPDFCVTALDGSVRYIEVKGWLDPKSKTQLQRMRRYYPDIPIELVGSDTYRRLTAEWKGVIPTWE